MVGLRPSSGLCTAQSRVTGAMTELVSSAYDIGQGSELQAAASNNFTVLLVCGAQKG